MQDHAPDNSALLVGRFVVKLDGMTRTGLAAHEVAELLADHAGASPGVYRIHRIDEVGRMELVGVAPTAFEQRDCLLFWRQGEDDARRDYEAVVEFGEHSPPPCRIEISLGHTEDRPMPHCVSLVFPRPCSESVGAWLGGCSSRFGDRADGSPVVLADYEASTTHGVVRRTLEPLAAAD